MMFARCTVKASDGTIRNAWVPEFAVAIGKKITLAATEWKEDGTPDPADRYVDCEIIACDNFLMPSKALAYCKPFKAPDKR
jgi:hypothetical protein